MDSVTNQEIVQSPFEDIMKGKVQDVLKEYDTAVRSGVLDVKAFKTAMRVAELYPSAAGVVQTPTVKQIPMMGQSDNAPKIKVSASQRQFVLLIGESFRTGVFKMSENQNVPWAEVCKHFVKSDGSEFKPKDLSSEWAKIGKGDKIQGGTEIKSIINSASNSNRPAERRAEAITGSLSESGVLKGLPGKARPKTRL